AGGGAAARLVQEPAASRAHGARGAQGARRDGRGRAAVAPHPGVGLERRDPLPGAAAAPRGERGDERGATGGARDTRRHDRGGAPMSELAVRAEIADMRGRGALPRENGELVFAAPWEGRVFEVAISVVRSLGISWEEFRRRVVGVVTTDTASACCW